MKTIRGRHSAFDIALGQRLRQLQIKRNMTQQKFADAMGVSYQQIQKYESGVNAIASSHIERLCETLDITPDQLFAINSAESRHIAGLSNYAIRMAQKLDNLNTDQRRAIAMLLRSFGVDDE